jgi:hypothetical protein
VGPHAGWPPVFQTCTRRIFSHGWLFPALRERDDAGRPSPPTVLSDENFVSEYLSKPKEKLAYTRLPTEAERLNFVKTTACDYIDTLQTILIAEIEYKVIFHYSTPVLWNGERADITFSRMRIQFFEDDRPPTNEVLLDRPILDFTIPDGLWLCQLSVHFHRTLRQ